MKYAPEQLAEVAKAVEEAHTNKRVALEQSVKAHKGRSCTGADILQVANVFEAYLNGVPDPMNVGGLPAYKMPSPRDTE